jgi:hypothetical protein
MAIETLDYVVYFTDRQKSVRSPADRLKCPGLYDEEAGARRKAHDESLVARSFRPLPRRCLPSRSREFPKASNHAIDQEARRGIMAFTEKEWLPRTENSLSRRLLPVFIHNKLALVKNLQERIDSVTPLPFIAPGMKHFASIVTAAASLSSATFAGDFHESRAHPDNGFFAPFVHLHTSELGTPYVHSFGIEPAFTGRDLFLDTTYREGNGVTEHESEIELEWAFTRRLGVIVERPYIQEDEKGVSSPSGFGGLAIVPRALLLEADRFLLTAQIETVLPSGSSTFGGDTSVAPGINFWNDLGNLFTLNSQIAIEHVFDDDSTELLYGFGLVKSFGESHAGHHHEHSQPNLAGLLHLHFEITGTTPLNGPEQGDFHAEGLAGISYGLTGGMDVRLGYQFPISSPGDFDHGITAGLIIHF